MERRIRTAWLMRRRFHLAANLATVVGALLGLIVVGIAMRAADTTWQSPHFLAGAAGTVLLGAALPRVAVLAAWRVVRSRNQEDWG
jgi:hypothetical protein